MQHEFNLEGHFKFLETSDGNDCQINLHFRFLSVTLKRRIFFTVELAVDNDHLAADLVKLVVGAIDDLACGNLTFMANCTKKLVRFANGSAFWNSSH